jgi:hypothetical protein
LKAGSLTGQVRLKNKHAAVIGRMGPAIAWLLQTQQRKAQKAQPRATARVSQAPHVHCFSESRALTAIEDIRSDDFACPGEFIQPYCAALLSAYRYEARYQIAGNFVT